MDYGYVEGRYYIATEWVGGIDLGTYIAEHGPLQPLQAAALALQVCAALRVVHQHGLIHLGIKPGNVLLMPGGKVKVSDVGLAGILSETGLSKTNVMIGNTPYMSPEQARAEAPGPESDLYSLGVILFEMLTDRLPFESNDAWSLLRMHSEQTPPAPDLLNPAVPPLLSAVVLRALQKQRRSRFASADEMAAALAELPMAAPLSIGARLVSGMAFWRSLTEFLSRGYRRNEAFGDVGPRWFHLAIYNRYSLAKILLIQFSVSFILFFSLLYPLSGVVLSKGPERSTASESRSEFGTEWISASGNLSTDQPAQKTGIELSPTPTQLQENFSTETPAAGTGASLEAPATGEESDVEAPANKGKKGKGPKEKGKKPKGKGPKWKGK